LIRVCDVIMTIYRLGIVFWHRPASWTRPTIWHILHLPDPIVRRMFYRPRSDTKRYLLLEWFLTGEHRFKILIKQNGTVWSHGPNSRIEKIGTVRLLRSCTSVLHSMHVRLHHIARFRHRAWYTFVSWFVLIKLHHYPFSSTYNIDSTIRTKNLYVYLRGPLRCVVKFRVNPHRFPLHYIAEVGGNGATRQKVTSLPLFQTHIPPYGATNPVNA